MTAAPANGITIEYDVHGDGEPLLLVMGLGGQLVGWPIEFVQRLADRGFKVIRFDNRDIGLSSKMPTPPPTRRQVIAALLSRRFAKSDYTARRHGRRRGRVARPPPHRPGPHGRHLDGRDDRPDARHHPSRPRGQPDVDHVQHRRSQARPHPPLAAAAAAEPDDPQPRRRDRQRGRGLPADLRAALRRRRRAGDDGGGLPPQLRRRRRRPPDDGRRRQPRPHLGPAPGARADARHPRPRRSVGAARRRDRHRQGDPGRPPRDVPGHGPRPAQAADGTRSSTRSSRTPAGPVPTAASAPGSPELSPPASRRARRSSAPRGGGATRRCTCRPAR